MAEVLGLSLLVLQTLFMTVEHNIVVAYPTGDIALTTEIDGLGDGAQLIKRGATFELAAYLHNRTLAHAIDDKVGARVAEDASAQTVLPVVIVGEASQRSLDATQHHGHIGIELFEYLGIHYRGIVGAHTMTTARSIGIVATQTTVRRIAVDHRVHGSRRDGEEETRTTQLLEITVITMPVGLGNEGHAIALRLEHTTDDGSAKRGVVDVGITREKDYVQLIPTTQLTFLLGSWEKISKSVFFQCGLF